MGLNTKWKGQIYLKTKTMVVLPLRKDCETNVRTYDIYVKKLLRY